MLEQRDSIYTVCHAPYPHSYLVSCCLSSSSAHLHITKIHLRMLRLELPHNLRLLLLIAARLASLLLPLIVHHLLDHPSRLAVQVTELAVFGRNLADVNARRRSHDVLPPFHLVRLRELDAQLLRAGGGGLKCPGGVVEEDGVGEGAL
jgi:hypothetical protein